jgi:serine/threonine protein kinase
VQVALAAEAGEKLVEDLLVLDVPSRVRLGPFLLTRKLASAALAERWVALHERAMTSHVVYRFGSSTSSPFVVEREDFLATMERAATLNHSHILKIEHYDFDESGRPYCVVPFTGDRDGLLNLGQLLRHKGGMLSLEEAKRAAEQVLSAIAYAHNLGCPHGPLGMDEILVDRHGSLKLELYAVSRMLGHPENDASEQQRREVQTSMAIVYQLLTGLRYEEPLIRPGRVIAGLHKSWDDLFETGLGEPGFASGAHALAALRACRTEPVTRLLSLDRMRSAMQRAMWAG